MEHSVSAYLARQSTNVLLGFLDQCRRDNVFSQYYMVIPDILDELSARGVEIPRNIQIQWLQFREQWDIL